MDHVDPKTLAPDERGYSVYTCVILAPEETQQRVQAVRDRVRAMRSMIPAHVTVRGPVGEIAGFDRVSSALRSVCEAQYPLEITVGQVEHWGTTSVFACEPSDAFRRLHNKLVEALRPLSTSVYLAGDQFRAHLTIFSDPAEDIELSRKIADQLVVDTAFLAHELEVWGHHGVPYTGRWDRVETFPFSGRAS